MKPLSQNVYRESVLADSPERLLMQRLVIFLAFCAVMYFGQDIIIPVVLALLLALLLNPLVKFFQNVGLPKSISVIMVVVGALCVIGLVAMITGGALAKLAQDLPNYQSSLMEKARAVRFATSGSGTLTKAADVLQTLQTEISQDPSKVTAVKPIPVEISNPNYGPLGPIATVISNIAHPLAQFGIVFLMLTFVLFNREDLRNRLVKLVGLGEINRTTVTMDEAGHRLSKLFRTQLLINSLTGLAIGAALFVMGIPAAVLWGLITAVMRFVPYIGTLLSAIFPVAIALAVGDGWSLALGTLGMIVVTEAIVGQIVEPLLLGHSGGLSPVAVVLSAAFWTAVWGPVGLVLATPLTICLVVLGRNIDGMNFIDTMLGSETALNAEAVFYQRMLAADPLEAAEQAAPMMEDGRFPEFLDEIAVPGLMLAHVDQQRRILTKEQATTIAFTFSSMLDELWPVEKKIEATPIEIVLVAGYGALNFAGTLALSALLKDKGIAHEMLSEDALMPGKEYEVPQSAKIVAICFLTPPSVVQINYLKKRALQRWSTLKIEPVSWNKQDDDANITSIKEFILEVLPMKTAEDVSKVSGAVAA
ncbi:MAG: AI-2E family transporter [Aestuariivirga sp.]